MKSQFLNPSDFIQLPRPLLYHSKTLLLQFPYSSLSLSQTPCRHAFRTKYQVANNAVSLFTIKTRKLSIRACSTSGSSSNSVNAPANVEEDMESAQLFEVFYLFLFLKNVVVLNKLILFGNRKNGREFENYVCYVSSFCTLF